MYPVVYSYKKSRTRELELSMESLRNLKEWDGRIFVIGDKPSFEGNYTHLTIAHPWGKDSGSKTNDEICAYLTAAHGLREFIIMADDIFILKPWSLEYHNRGSLEDHAKSRPRMDSYARQLITTNTFLASHNKSVLSYEMHIPFLVRSNRLRRMSEMIMQTEPMFIRSMLGNWYGVSSIEMEDPKVKQIPENAILYSSSDSTFDYEKVRNHLK